MAGPYTGQKLVRKISNDIHVYSYNVRSWYCCLSEFSKRQYGASGIWIIPVHSGDYSRYSGDKKNDTVEY